MMQPRARLHSATVEPSPDPGISLVRPVAPFHLLKPRRCSPIKATFSYKQIIFAAPDLILQIWNHQLTSTGVGASAGRIGTPVQLLAWRKMGELVCPSSADVLGRSVDEAKCQILDILERPGLAGFCSELRSQMGSGFSLNQAR
jgi:hypothetical protein